ncbi:uncharacterized protein BX664DRAFT_343532 [Halteromyces radiatus]|uniref:uncharacterized protein n=1 Tax=Halteromyces radiatus TaxID=101107 RepID=UPI00221F1336|nr:uncharacterized protein BX664DRAFT_343532 [Halteromyces radiatus]KAI8077809.1 hypothetical protein BX664DRAFT_343532 [Halteromyces radiatus]
MSLSSSGSNLCRYIWMKRFCQDIVKAQHGRPLSLATKQTNRLSSPVNYQPIPTFLTPPHRTNKKKALERAVLEQVKENRIDNAQRILTDIYRSGHTPTIGAYNQIIKALSKQFNHRQNQIQAHALLEEMAEHGITPNSQTYIQLLLGYAIHTKSNDHIHQMQLLFDILLHCEHGQRYKRTHFKIKKLVEVMATQGHGAILPIMMATFNAGIKLDISIWNIALAGCVRGGYMEASEQLLDIMRLSRQEEKNNKEQDLGSILPDMTSYHTVISGYLDQNMDGNNMDRAIGLFQKMMDDGVVADYRIYQLFLRAYTTQSTSTTMMNKDVQLDTLQRLWRAMMTTTTDELQIGDDVLETLLEYYVRHQEYPAVEQVYWDLRQHRYSLSGRMVSLFFKTVIGFSKQQRLISGIAMFYDLLSYGHGADNAATSSLLRACSLRGQLDMAQQILDVIEDTLQQPCSISHYSMMVHGYVAQGKMELATTVFNKVIQLCNGNKSFDVQCLSAARLTMIRGYFKSRQLDRAETLFHQHLSTQQDDIKMDKRLVKIMIEGYGTTRNKTKLDEFLGRNDIILDDIHTRDILIQSRLNCGDLDGAERDLQEGLKLHDAKWLRNSIQLVLSRLALNGNVASCEYWMNLLTTHHLMNATSYGALIVCYGEAGETIKLKRMYDDINKQGLKLEKGIENKIKSQWL